MTSRRSGAADPVMVLLAVAALAASTWLWILHVRDEARLEADKNVERVKVVGSVQANKFHLPTAKLDIVGCAPIGRCKAAQVEKEER